MTGRVDPTAQAAQVVGDVVHVDGPELHPLTKLIRRAEAVDVEGVAVTGPLARLGPVVVALVVGGEVGGCDQAAKRREQ